MGVAVTPGTMAPLDCATVEDLAPAFVLGALETREAEAVRSHVAGCGRGHPELAELGGIVAHLAEAADPIEPADALRARVLDAVGSEAGAPERPAPSAEPSPRRGWARRLHPARVMALMALVVVVALTGAVVQLAGRLADAQAYADQLRHTASLAATPGSRSVALAPAVAGGPSGVAVLESAGTGTVVLNGLAPLRGPEVYEVWLIGTDGRPIPAGELRTTDAGAGWLETLSGVPAGPVTVAVTHEPGPAPKTPTPPVLTSGASS
jgi:hypothetical protein